MPITIHVCLTLLFSVVFIFSSSKFSFVYQQPDKSATEILRDILSQPNSQIDLAVTKLTIDKLAEINHVRCFVPLSMHQTATRAPVYVVALKMQ